MIYFNGIEFNFGKFCIKDIFILFVIGYNRITVVIGLGIMFKRFGFNLYIFINCYFLGIFKLWMY